MHCNNLWLVLGLGLVRVSSRVRVRIRVKVRVSVMVRVSITTSWVVNFALFRCYRPVIYTSPFFSGTGGGGLEGELAEQSSLEKQPLNGSSSSSSSSCSCSLSKVSLKTFVTTG